MIDCRFSRFSWTFTVSDNELCISRDKPGLTWVNSIKRQSQWSFFFLLALHFYWKNLHLTRQQIVCERMIISITMIIKRKWMRMTNTICSSHRNRSFHVIVDSYVFVSHSTFSTFYLYRFDCHQGRMMEIENGRKKWDRQKRQLIDERKHTFSVNSIIVPSANENIDHQCLCIVFYVQLGLVQFNPCRVRLTWCNLYSNGYSIYSFTHRHTAGTCSWLTTSALRVSACLAAGE